MRVLAVDMGATSIRVASVDLASDAPEIDIVHRWPHGPQRHPDGSLRWDWAGIVGAIDEGLERALETGPPIASIGVDGWGVDYGLLDERGALLGAPYSYRDSRTEGYRQVVDRLGAQELYERTGIQLMPINTLFQLAAHDREELGRAHRLLLLPDLVVHHLTGSAGTERSNASTTALLDLGTGDWADELLELAGLDRAQLAPLRFAGEPAGTWRDIPVHLVGSHDTASAFLGVPGASGSRTAIISSGTWVLVGTERDEPLVSPSARAANLSNERGALGGVRLLKNVMGFWMLERCREAWGSPPISELVEGARRAAPPAALVDARDDRFLAPDDMEAEVRAAAGLGPAASRADVIRCIVESIAAATASTIAELAAVSHAAFDQLYVVGGGARMDLMNQLLLQHAGLPVRVGTAEAAALGNAVVQGLALGYFPALDDARAWTARSGRDIASGDAAGPGAEVKR